MERTAVAKPPWVIAQQTWQRSSSTSVELSFSYGPWVDAPEAAELIAAKEKIAHLERTRQWELLKKMVNPYEMVYTHEDPLFHPSISVIKPLSRSYFKLVEMLHVLQFFEGLPKQSPKIRTAHVAEGPGGFIQAVTDLAEHNKRIVERVTAMTLRPTDQYVPGWRRATNFLNRHREVKLHYGIDGTGDVYNVENQESFVRVAVPGAHLFTADGGFDFSINYDLQERRVFHLLVCSATAGLRSLTNGGSFVLKIFDLFSESTKILVLLMGRCFREWMLYKPALSRPCNSERYFLARGFKGVSVVVLATLLQMQEAAKREEYPRGLERFAAAEEAAYLQHHIEENEREQRAALARTDLYIAHPEVWYANQLPRDFETSRAWCNAFRIPVQFQRPLPLTFPSHLPWGECISSPAAGPLPPSPGGATSLPAPCDPTLPTSPPDCPCQTAHSPSPSQTDGGSRGQTQGDSL